VSAVELVERREAAPVTCVQVIVGRDANVDLDTLARFAQAWAQSLGVAIDVSKAERSANALRSGVPLVVDSGTAEALSRVVNDGVVIVDFDGAAAQLGPGLPDPDRIGGRGIDGYRWAVRHLVSSRAWPVSTYRYGEEADQLADLRLPATDGMHPAVVLIHGGGWKHRWQRDLMAPIAIDLVKRGYASWNIEFRRVGGRGGWPMTFDDVRAAIDALPSVEERANLDLDRVCFLGHSSGGHLALWAAGEQTRVRPALVVAIAAVSDVVEAERRQLVGGENIILQLLGGAPVDMPDRYTATSPRARLPLGIPQLLVQGLRDYIPDLVDLNRSYEAAARAAGDDVELLELAGVEHLEPIESTSAAWHRIRDELERTLTPSGVLSITKEEADVTTRHGH
jgi:acetyl esterase/lipase